MALESNALAALLVIREHRVHHYSSESSPDRDDPWFDLWSCTGCCWKGDSSGAGEVHVAMEIGKAIDGEAAS